MEGLESQLKTAQMQVLRSARSEDLSAHQAATATDQGEDDQATDPTTTTTATPAAVARLNNPVAISEDFEAELNAANAEIARLKRENEGLRAQPTPPQQQSTTEAHQATEPQQTPPQHQQVPTKTAPAVA